MVEKKPNFIVVGAMKAATTSLYTYLKQHPKIFMTKVKEPMFFNNFKQENKYKISGKKSKKPTTLKEYLAMFDDVKNEKAIGEASPAYIYNPQAPQLIKEHLSNVKIIAILRQPTDRAYSNYLHTKRADREDAATFQEAIELENKRIKDHILNPRMKMHNSKKIIEKEIPLFYISDDYVSKLETLPISNI